MHAPPTHHPLSNSSETESTVHPHSPDSDYILLGEGLDGVVDDVISGGGADVDLCEVRRPLADHEREALSARRRRRRPRRHRRDSGELRVRLRVFSGEEESHLSDCLVS